MNLPNYYWYFKAALTPRFCDEVIQHGLNQTETMARTGGYDNKELTKRCFLELLRRSPNCKGGLKGVKR